MSDDLQISVGLLYEQIAALEAVVERGKERADKFMWQVRDTCKRAEAAEAKVRELEGRVAIRDGECQAKALIIEAAEADRARLRAALELADAALSGANMDMKAVERKVRAALAPKADAVQEEGVMLIDVLKDAQKDGAAAERAAIVAFARKEAERNFSAARALESSEDRGDKAIREGCFGYGCTLDRFANAIERLEHHREEGR